MWVWIILGVGMLALLGPIAYFERERMRIEDERHYGKMKILKRMI